MVTCRIAVGVLAGAALALHAGPGVAQVAPPPPAFALSGWTTAEGLPRSEILGLARDRAGYLWIGTAAGIARFDGDTFVSYPRGGFEGVTQPVRAVTTDRHGTVWFAEADSGIWRLDPDGNRIPGATRPPVRPWHLAVGASDSVWISQGADLWLHTAHTWRQVPAVPNYLIGSINALLVDSSGVLWVGGERGLLQLRGSVAHLIRDLPCARVFAVAAAGGGDVWIGTCGGLGRVSSEGRSQSLRLDPSVTSSIYSLLPRGDDLLWFGDEAGLHRLEVVRQGPSRWRGQATLFQALQLEGAKPTVMVGGADGALWVGTGGAGLRWIRRMPASRITRADGLPDRQVHHVVPDGRGGLWLGGGCGGLVNWHEGEVRIFRAPALGLHSSCVRGLLDDRAGNLWIGEVGYLSRVDSQGHVHPVAGGPELADLAVTPLLEDSKGRIWYGTHTGRLGYITPDGTEVRLDSAMLSLQQVWSAVEDPSGGVWVGQEGEITHLVDDRVTTRLGKEQGVPAGPIRALVFDHGDLWLASYGGGLARYRRGSGVQRLLSRGRQFERALSAIVVDTLGRFWLLGDGGIAMAPHAELAEALDRGQPLPGMVELGPADGVPEGNGGFPNVWLDRRANRLWAATVDGLATINLARFSFEDVAPSMRIDDIRFDGVAVAATDSLRVPASVNGLEIRFTAPSFSARDGLQFRYRLRGRDRDWVESGSTRTARYVGLPPGRYTFELSGRSRDGTERSAPVSLVVTVVPKWWQTLLARTLFLVAALAATWSAFYWLTRSLRNRAQVLQHEIDERELAEAHAAAAARELAHVSRLATAGELATSIAHELNQPLTAVVVRAQTAQRLVGPGQTELAGLLDGIVDQSDRASNVIRTLRAFVAKQWAPEQVVTLNAVVGDTLRLLRSELTGRGVTIRVVNELRRPAQVRGDPVQLQQVLANLLLNAAEAVSDRPAPERRATVLLRSDDETSVRLSVFDSGSGLEPELLARVFEPFFTTRASGLGLGLSLSRSIVEAHSGRLWGESSPGQGSAFHVLLPVWHP